MALLGLVLLAACSTVSSIADLIEDLQDEGFTDVSANVSQTDTSVLVVSADAPAGTSTSEAQDQAAEVVWTTFPRRFDGLRVSIDGEGRRWTHAQLEEQLGPRPDGLDSKGELGDDVEKVVIFAVIGMLVAGVIVIGIVAMVVLLVVRAQRRNAATRPRPQPWMPPGVPGPVPPAGGWATASPPQTVPTPYPTGAPQSVPPPIPTPDPVSLAKEPDDTDGPADDPPADGPPQAWPGAAPPVPDPRGVPGSWTDASGAPRRWADVGRAEAPEPPPVATEGHGRRAKDPDARKLGRRPRGPVPDEDHTPPGWA